MLPPSAPTLDLPANLRATKLIVPPARAQLVVRSRLFKRLEAGLQGKLTLIAAPAGFGKTTLVSAWRSTALGSALPFAWVSLDAGDNDPLLFWSYFLVALDGLVPGVSTSALTLLQSSQPPPIEYILMSMLNTFTNLLAGKPERHIVLVLEDYHVITNSLIHLALSWLLDCLPPTLHLLIITRADPALPLARMRVKGDLTELHADDLRFTTEEVAAFLNQIMGLALTSDDLATLERRTESWVAGLQLAALALRDHSDRPGFIRTFSGNNRYIVDYLAAEVIESQSARVQTFLLYTSILDRMCGALCDVLLGLLAPGPRSDEGASSTVQGTTILPTVLEPTSFGESSSSQNILEELERANLFVIPLDEERHWYRYHHLFADVLGQRLRRSAMGAVVTGLHERASSWYEQQGLVADADGG